MEQNRTDNSIVVERSYRVYAKRKRCPTTSGIGEGKSLTYSKCFREQILPFNIQNPEINEKGVNMGGKKRKEKKSSNIYYIPAHIRNGKKSF